MSTWWHCRIYQNSPKQLHGRLIFPHFHLLQTNKRSKSGKKGERKKTEKAEILFSQTPYKNRKFLSVDTGLMGSKWWCQWNESKEGFPLVYIFWLLWISFRQPFNCVHNGDKVIWACFFISDIRPKANESFVSMRVRKNIKYVEARFDEREKEARFSLGLIGQCRWMAATRLSCRS